MKNKYYGLWIFFVIPILTELLTSNRSFSQLFSPGEYLFFVFAYSMPVFLINELGVRWRLGIIGLFALGLAYGIFNEGIMAQTLFMSGSNVPIAAFEGYCFWGINLPWAVTILPWHALFSVIYPIVIFRTLYSNEFQQARFPLWGLIIMAGVYFILGSCIHVGFNLGTPILAMWLSWGLIAGLMCLSRGCPCQPKIQWPQGLLKEKLPVMRALLIGSLLIFPLVSSVILAERHVLTVVHVVMSTTLYVVIFLIFKKKHCFDLPVFALIAMGHYLTQALISMVLFGQDPDRLLGEIVVVVLLIVFLSCIFQQYARFRTAQS